LVVVAPTLDQQALKQMLKDDIGANPQIQSGQTHEIKKNPMPDIPALIIKKTIRPQEESLK
jgi:zinc protease